MSIGEQLLHRCAARLHILEAELASAHPQDTRRRQDLQKRIEDERVRLRDYEDMLKQK